MNNVHLDTVLQDPQTVTPSLVLDYNIINENYDRFIQAFPGGEIFYAMKANANPNIVKYVVAKGGGVEIASLAELQVSLNAGATGDRIICSNPIKNPQFIKTMHEVGVYAMVVDSTYEVEKVAKYAPGCRVYVRLAVDNTGSVLPLAGKFGVDGNTALDLFDQARDLGLQPMGISFHVGSQCLSPLNWVNAIAACADVWREAEARGHKMTFLDIGGGFPAGHYHTPSIPTIEQIGSMVMDAVREHIPAECDFMLVLEPGRGLSGEAGRVLSSVVGKAARGDQMWIYLDAGVFNGFMESFEGFPPVIEPLDETAMTRATELVTIAGPTCDSCDVVARNVRLPQLNIDDRIVFYDLGAYTNEYAVPFNGFPIPQLIEINLEKVMAQVAKDRSLA